MKKDSKKQKSKDTKNIKTIPESTSLFFQAKDNCLKLEILPKAIHNLNKILANNSNKTGGILIGYYKDREQTAVVTEITPPPIDSYIENSTFIRGTSGLTARLNLLWTAIPRRYYLGEWHTHLTKSAQPHSQDDAQMRVINSDPNYQCAMPILIIVATKTKPVPTISTFVYENEQRINLEPTLQFKY